MNRFRHFAFIALTVAAIVSFGEALKIEAKARLAQYLIADAWEETLQTGAPVRPWSWADTWPVARIRSIGHPDLYVLAGAHGSALAFGPGLMDGTSLPGKAGASVIAGHRDTHFNFLRHLSQGDTFEVQVQNGEWYHYIVQNAYIVDTQLGADFPPESGYLYLVTCYPFDAIDPGGPLRYVVTANHSLRRTYSSPSCLPPPGLMIVL